MGNTKLMKVYNKELSIQVTLSGFSFSIDTPTSKRNGRSASYDFDSSLADNYSLSSVVEWSVPSALVIPYEVFDHRSIDSYLLGASMIDPLTQRSIFAVRGEYVVVWSVDKELDDYLAQRLVDVEHSHPLLRLLQYRATTPTVIVEVDSALVMHIAIRGMYGLEAAHSVRINNVEDILFYVTTLCGEHQISSPKVVITSKISDSTLEFLSRYYSNIRILNK